MIQSSLEVALYISMQNFACSYKCLYVSDLIPVTQTKFFKTLQKKMSVTSVPNQARENEQ